MKILRIIKESLREIKSNKMRAFLMMLGIIIGVSSLITIISTGEGAKADIIERFKNMTGKNLDYVIVRANGIHSRLGLFLDEVTPTLTLEDLEVIKHNLSDVKETYPVQLAQVNTKYGNNSSLSTLHASSYEYISKLAIIDIEKGDFFDTEDYSSLGRVCIIGNTVVKNLFDDDDPIGKTIRINGVIFKVKGVFKKKGSGPIGMDLDDLVYAPISTCSKRLFNRDNLSMALIQVSDLKKIDKVIGEVESILRKQHYIVPPKEDDFKIRDPKESINTYNKIFRTFDIFLGLIASISLLVGGIVITNITLISVSERRRDIGIKRAIGAKKKDIILQFLIETSLLALIAGIIGVILGSIASKVIASFIKLPEINSWSSFALAFGCSLVIGICSGIYPARKAAMINPIDALRA